MDPILDEFYIIITMVFHFVTLDNRIGASNAFSATTVDDRYFSYYTSQPLPVWRFVSRTRSHAISNGRGKCRLSTANGHREELAGQPVASILWQPSVKGWVTESSRVSLRISW